MKAVFIYHYSRQAGFYAPIAGLWYFSASLCRTNFECDVIPCEAVPFSCALEGIRR